MQSLNKKINKLCDKLSDQAAKRRGGAWTTGLCVVGSDMASGLSEAKSVIADYHFPPGKSEAEHCRVLAALIVEAADNYPFHDSEGYAAGTMKQLAHDIENIPTKDND